MNIETWKEDLKTWIGEKHIAPTMIASYVDENIVQPLLAMIKDKHEEAAMYFLDAEKTWDELKAVRMGQEVTQPVLKKLYLAYVGNFTGSHWDIVSMQENGFFDSWTGQLPYDKEDIKIYELPKTPVTA